MTAPVGPYKSIHSQSCAQVNPKRARYFFRRSASLVEDFSSRETANKRRPASLSDRDVRQVATTKASCIRSNRSSFSNFSAPSRLSRTSSSRVRSEAVHLRLNRSISSLTNSSLMRPDGASVAMRVMDAAKSRKFAVQAAVGEVAKST